MAPNHDHYFSFRLNFDVDGSVWVVQSEVAKTEAQAKLRVSMERPEIWRVINPKVKNQLGLPVSYEIVPGANAWPLLLPEDYPQRRAGFTDYQLWVTPFRENERYAAGDYPAQSKGGDGLPAWTRADRAIENTDIVVWYTLGFHHAARTEDFPVMPTTWFGFELRPYNFFARNPALDLPR